MFHSSLKTLKSSGVFKRIQNDLAEYNDESTLIKGDSNEDSNNAVEISSLEPVFITVAILYVISVTILVVEIVFNKIKKII